MKKIKATLCISSLLCIFSCISVFASENNNKIPSYMLPGTVIHYDSNKEMKIIKEGTIKTNINKATTYEELNDMPEIKPNMTVTYDALGGPIISGSYFRNNDDNIETNTNELSKGMLIASTFSIYNKSHMISLNLDDNTKNCLIKDRSVAITGDCSKDCTKIAYADALGDTDPWQIYLYDSNNNKTSQITTDKFGKVHAKISEDSKYVYFLTGIKGGLVKVGKVNIENISHEMDIIDKDDSDRGADSFDIKNNKLIMSTKSRSLELQKWKENKGNYLPITHTIVQTDFNGNNSKNIAQIQASLVETISYNYDGKKIIIGGCDINGDFGYGIYQLSVDTGTLTTILSDKILKNTENLLVSEIAHTPLAKMSKDEDLIYFTGINKNSKETTVEGISCHLVSIFSYNINTKEFKEIFTPTVESFITDLNIKLY